MANYLFTDFYRSKMLISSAEDAFVYFSCFPLFTFGTFGAQTSSSSFFFSPAGFKSLRVLSGILLIWCFSRLDPVTVK